MEDDELFCGSEPDDLEQWIDDLKEPPFPTVAKEEQKEDDNVSGCVPLEPEC